MTTFTTTPGIITITRKAYMAEPFVSREQSSHAHANYYHQFATDRLVGLVSTAIGSDRIKRSTDKHLNDIPLDKWDSLHGVCWSIVGHLIREADPCGKTLSVTCSALKAAAYRIQREG